MNILRWKRKSKKKIKLKTLVLFIFSLIMTTFAWFAYSRVLNTSLDIHMAAWDMKYSINGVEKTNPIGIEIPILYPTMPEQMVTVDIKNNGETLVDIVYEVQTITIIGKEYEIVNEGETNTSPDYIILSPAVLETDTETGIQTYKGVLTSDINQFPFTIEIEHSAQVEAAGEGYLKVTVNWIGDNNDLDSEWGYLVGEYLAANPTETSVIHIGLSLNSYQANPEGTTITTTMPSTAETQPYLPTGFSRVAGTNLNTGLVIKDGLGNEYVWVEVPKNATVYGTDGLNITEFTATEYQTIRTKLKTYTQSYKSDTYSDTFFLYQAVGIAKEDYELLEQKMLKSIYQNGGFYIGRYETGIAKLEDIRTSSGDTTQTPVIKANSYPYNYLTCSQAQGLASGMASGDHTSSLMFGLQWDLVLKYIETKTELLVADLNADSTSWGNYRNNLYYITNTRSGYNYRNESTNKLLGWTQGKYDKTEASSILLKTGSSNMFRKQNIFDIAGNVWEYTFEYTANGSLPCSVRGGNYYSEGLGYQANRRGAYSTSSASDDIGFRVTIY